MTGADLDQVTRALDSSDCFPEACHPTGVLVVSANLDTRLLLAHHLEGLGCGVWTAGSGRDALEVAIEHPVGIDVLICDGNVSDLPAPELYCRLKTRRPGLRCLMLATAAHARRAEEAARFGAVVLDLEGSMVTPVEGSQLATAAHGW